MQHSFPYFLGPALIPEIRPYVSAGTSRNVHLCLIAVSAVGAFPDELSVLIVDDLDLAVVSAYLAVITLGVELCVHNVVIDVLHYRNDCLDIVLKIGHLDIADSSAG